MRALSRSFSSLSVSVSVSVSVLSRRSPLVSRLAISTVARHHLIPSSTPSTPTFYQPHPHRAFAKMTEHKTFDSATIESLVDKSQATFLGRHTNQAQGIAQYAIDFCVKGVGKPDEAVLRRTELFHTDSVFCGLSALALGTNAPTVLRQEALEYTKDGGATVFGSKQTVFPEKAVLANSSAVREWDSNGTVFGYNARLGKSHMAGEFGHNDFYPVVIAAVQQRGLDGATALRAMLATDEIRGRLAEVFSLKTYRIDHVVHGAIASAAVYGALMGATVQQIEYAIGMVVAHYIPFRAIRAGEQLSDSKGASAAISTEVAILAMHRAMRGFVGPADIFRNPEAIFRNFEPTKDNGSPFDLVLSHSGSDFAVMGMHFKLGLYEHQSAGALQGLVDVVRTNPTLLEEGAIKKIKVVAYQPAFGIIGDPHKRNPTTRQSADHSMVYILATLLKKAQAAGKSLPSDSDAVWQHIMLTPSDYRRDAVMDPTTRKLMDLIEFAHGGKSYDEKYPEGIPTSIVLTDKEGKEYDSGLVMFPTGHARNTTANLEAILNTKFKKLGALAVKDVDAAVAKLSNLSAKSATELHDLYNFDIQFGGGKRKIDSSENGSSKKAKHDDEENEY